MKPRIGNYHNSGAALDYAANVLPLDPMMFGADLRLRESISPLGFPAVIETNSRLVLDAAAESWGTFSGRFDTAPLRLRILVTPGTAKELPPDPVFRGQDYLMQVVASAENFACCDARAGFAACWLSEAVAAES